MSTSKPKSKLSDPLSLTALRRVAKAYEEFKRDNPDDRGGTTMRAFGDLHPTFSRVNAQRPRSDSLQKLIRSIVEIKPDITARGLCDELSRLKGKGIVEDCDDEMIYFFKDPAKGREGQQGEACISGLKDRLYRAKREILRASR